MLRRRRADPAPHARARRDGAARRRLHDGGRWACRRSSRSSRTCRSSAAVTTRGWRSLAPALPGAAGGLGAGRPAGAPAARPRAGRRRGLLRAPGRSTPSCAAARRWDLVGQALQPRSASRTPPADEVGHPRGAAVCEWALPAAAGVALLALSCFAGPAAGWRWRASGARRRPDLARAGMGYNPAIDRATSRCSPTRPRSGLRARRPRSAFVADRRHPAERDPDGPRTSPRRAATTCRSRAASTGSGAATLSPEFATQSGPLPAGHPAVAAEGRRQAPAAAQPARDAVRDAAARATPLLHVRGLRLVHDGPDARLYRSAGTQPRAAVVGAEQVVASSDDALARVAAPGFSLARSVVTEIGESRACRRRSHSPAGTAQIVAGDDPDRLVVDVSVPAHGTARRLRRLGSGLEGDGRRPRGEGRARQLRLARRARRPRGRTASSSATGRGASRPGGSCRWRRSSRCSERW